MDGKRGLPLGVQAFFAAFSVMLVLGTAAQASPLGGLYWSLSPRDILKPLETASPLAPLLAYAAFAAALGLLLTRLNVRRAGDGLKAGAVFGLTVSFPGYLLLYGAWDIAPAFIALDCALRVVEMALAGGAAGFMLGFGAAVAAPDRAGDPDPAP